VVLGEVVTDWVDVVSGVPQGSVLGPLLFTIFINDMPDGLKNMCKMFADDSKLLGTIQSNEDINVIQSDLDKLSNWAKLSGMTFNVNKCKIMRVGKCPVEVTENVTFAMSDNLGVRRVLEEVTEERDLGVVWQNNLKWSEHVNRVCSTAYAKLGMLRRTFKSWSNARTFKLLYTTFVRPHLEYAVPVWNALCNKDKNKIEKVQKQATKMVPQIKDLKYKERLLNLGLPNLEQRRERGDMIQMFKIHRNFNSVEFSHTNISCKTNYAEISGPCESILSRRRTNIRVEKEFVKNCTGRETFFTNRVADQWNKLDEKVVAAKTVNGFKARYDKYIIDKLNYPT
jgi:hypothetical protein